MATPRYLLLFSLPLPPPDSAAWSGAASVDVEGRASDCVRLGALLRLEEGCRKAAFLAGVGGAIVPLWDGECSSMSWRRSGMLAWGCAGGVLSARGRRDKTCEGWAREEDARVSAARALSAALGLAPPPLAPRATGLAAPAARLARACGSSPVPQAHAAPGWWCGVCLGL